VLKFADVEARIQTGDVFLFQGSSIFGRLVKLRTLSRYSHAGIALRVKADGCTRVCVLEALEPHGVRMFPLDQYLEGKDRVDWFAITEDYVYMPQVPLVGEPGTDPEIRLPDDGRINREKMAAYALKQWGRRYAWRQLFWSFSITGRFLRYLFRWNLTQREKGKFFCSELVAHALAHAGYRTEDGLTPIQTTPEDVSRYPCLQRRGELTL
jgi:hypothetical protein